MTLHQETPKRAAGFSPAVWRYGRTKPGRSPADLPVTSRHGWLLWPVLVLLGFLLFAHLGCHGDEDNELFHGFGTGIGIGCDRNCTLERN